jgi:hypothetical protein
LGQAPANDHIVIFQTESTHFARQQLFVEVVGAQPDQFILGRWTALLRPSART